MIIARHWAKAFAETTDARGQTIRLHAWGWSESSVEEAERRAAESAERVARRFSRGEALKKGYGYLDRPPREEIVEEIRGESGETVATLTRNVYGALILNTNDLMIIDVDTPVESGASRLVASIRSVFGKKADDRFAVLENQLRVKARLFGRDTYRIYRTYGGFRIIVQSRPIQTADPDSSRLLSHFGADPLYVRLCENQGSFRARLTPKFWRCGGARPPNRYPWSNEQSEAAYRAWERDYESNSAGYATCRLVGEVGSELAAPRLAGLIRLHDAATRASSDFPLA